MALLVPLGDELLLALLLPVALADVEALEADADADALAEAESEAPDVEDAPDGVVPVIVLKVLAGVVPVEDPVAVDETGGGLSLVISNCCV